MALKLEIVGEHRDIVGDNAVREFAEEGGTIGRSLQSDWILPDPDRYISGKHAIIDYKAGAYYLVDTSSNGVFVNGDCEPLGKGNPRRLFNGDVIRFGDFVINVSVEGGESIVMPLDDESDKPVTDHARSMVDEDAMKTGLLLLDEEALTGDDEFQSALFGNHDETDVAQDADLAPIEPPAPEPEQKAPPVPLAEAGLDEKELIDAFLGGMGFDRSDLNPQADLTEVMRNAGEVLREFVDGTTQLLASRANLKNAFRLDQTTVLPRHNNPLKLSANSRDSMMQLLVGREGEYLGPRDAAREVCRDLLFHQDAFLDAMNNAFLEFADRFDPIELQEGFDRTLGSGILGKLTNKYKYWNMFEDLYPIMTEKGGGRFPQMYAEEFVHAYERQIAEYKRLGGVDENLKETVILGDSDYNPARDFEIDPEISAELEAMNDSPFEADDLVVPAPVEKAEGQ
ncbi:MAG: type VI secretion system-associated FHA domain protein TagH [Woeseiaceae bacterium]